MHCDPVRLTADLHDGREILERVEGQVLVKVRQDDVRRAVPSSV